MGRVAGRFARYEPRLRAGRLVLGLLPDLPRKNCWTIAEWAGEASPHGMQHLLGRAVWDADAVRGDVREYLAGHLHDEAAVLVVDETGDVKKGPCTVRGPAPVHRHGRQDRELPGRRLPPLRRRAGTRGGGPGVSWTPGTTSAGSLVTRSTAATRNCARLWRNAASAMFSRWPARPKWPPAQAPSAPMPW
jgi:hypothetical protein